MEHLIQAFNQGVKYLQEENFEEAEHLLGPLVEDYPSFTQARWAYGLLQVLSGFPHKALKLWEPLQITGDLLSCKLAIVAQLPIYEELYKKYNDAIKLAQQGVLEQALHQFKELLSAQKEAPLPVDFYHAYLLTQAMTENDEQAIEAIKAFPLYVQNSRLIRDCEKSLQEPIANKFVLEAAPAVHANQDRKRVNGLLIGSGMAASLIIGAFAMLAVNDFKNREAETPAIQQKTVEKAADKEKTAGLEQELSALKDEKAKLENDLHSKNQDLMKQQELNEMISLANLDKSQLSLKAGQNSYKNGLAAWKNRDYAEAADLMEKSLALQPDEYFSDDALYFLIKSKQKLNKDEELPALFDRFLSQTGVNYTQSPYRGALLLNKAQFLIKQGKSADAKPLLEEILSEYSQEWTAAEAASILKQISGGSQ